MIQAQIIKILEVASLNLTGEETKVKMQQRIRKKTKTRTSAEVGLISKPILKTRVLIKIIMDLAMTEA